MSNTTFDILAVIIALLFIWFICFLFIPYISKENEKYYQKQKVIFLECQNKTQDIDWCYSQFIE
jgi:hypothetical protein